MFKAKIIFLGVILAVSFSACSWFSHAKNVVTTPNSSESIEKSKVVNASRLKEGGKVAMLAFKAGVGVEATEQLDKTSLEVVKGFSDFLAEHSSPLRFVGADAAEETTFVLSGNFSSIDVVSSLWPWAQTKITISLTIDGKLQDATTKETIAVFNFKRKFFGKKADLYQLGYLLGQDIGQFLVTGSQ